MSTNGRNGTLLDLYDLVDREFPDLKPYTGAFYKLHTITVNITTPNDFFKNYKIHVFVLKTFESVDSLRILTNSVN